MEIFTNTFNRFKDIVKKNGKEFYTIKGKKFRIFGYKPYIQPDGMYNKNNLLVTNLLNNQQIPQQDSIFYKIKIVGVSAKDNTITILCKINNLKLNNTSERLKEFLNSVTCTNSLEYTIIKDTITFTIPLIHKLLVKIKKFDYISVNGYITISDDEKIEELLVTVENCELDIMECTTENTAYKNDIRYAYLYSKLDE